MITNLPPHFAEITTVTLVNGVEVEGTVLLLVENLNPDMVRGYDQNAYNVRFDLLGETTVTKEPKVVNIKFLDKETDLYQEFITSLNFADMHKTLHRLSIGVCSEFELILSRCPENYDTLFEMLKIHALDK